MFSNSMLTLERFQIVKDVWFDTKILHLVHLSVLSEH